ncbi:MAG: SPOR domain-containing protein [Pseudomonadota bacterium]
MTIRRMFFGLALVMTFGLPMTAHAQPTNVPPDAGDRFVDTDGCAWQRLEIGGQVAWAAVLGQDREQVCIAPDKSVAAPTAQAVEPAPMRRSPVFPSDGYHIQVGAFRDPANASAAVDQLMAQGLAVLTQTRGRHSAPLQVVYTGPFATEATAHTIRQTVRRLGYSDAFIWHPSPH